MPLSKEEIQVLLTARSNLSPVLGRAAASLKRLKSNIGGITASLGKMSAAVGGINALSLTAITAAGVKVGSEFTAAADLLEESGERIQKVFLDVKAFNPQVEIDNLAEGLRTMTERFSEAANGGGDAAEAIERLGADLSVTGVVNQLEEVRSKFQDIESVSERIELSNILFGDEDARQVLNYLKATEDQLERVRSARDNLGLIVPNQALENIRQARAAMESIKTVFTQFAVTVAGNVTPLITEAAAKLLAFVQANGGVVNVVEAIYANVSARTREFIATVAGAADVVRRIYANLSNDLSAFKLDELIERREEIEASLQETSRYGVPAQAFAQLQEQSRKDLAKINEQIATVESKQRSLTSATDDSKAAWVDYFDQLAIGNRAAIQLNESLTGVGNTTSNVKTQATKAAEAYESAVERINSLEIDGLAGLDLSGAQLARRSLSDLQANELADVMGLDVSDQQKSDLALALRERIGVLNLQLKMRAELAIDEAVSREPITKLVDQYNAQLGRDDAVQIPIALDTIEAGKKNTAADSLKDTTKQAQTLASAIGLVRQGFTDLSTVARGSSDGVIDEAKRTGQALASIAAIVAAVNAAKSASFSANPLAAIGAYLTVGSTLFAAVSSIGGISSGNAPTSLPGGGGGGGSGSGGGASGPQGGTVPALEQPAGDTFNVTFQGRDSDTVELGQVRNFLRLLQRNGDARRQFQTVLVN